jgi:hypothetical protein
MGQAPGARRAPLLDNECHQVRQQSRLPGAGALQRKKRCRTLMRRKRRAYELAKAQTFLRKMLENSGLAIKRFKPKQARQPTQVPLHKWTEHIQAHFRGGQGAALLLQTDLLGLAAGRSAGYPLPSLDSIESEVRQALRSVKGYTSPSEDGVGVAFFKYATVGLGKRLGESLQEPLFVPVLARLFEAVLKSGRVPAAWKAAKLAPIFKKGGPTQTSNYRMIAVSSVLYGLFASVANRMLTKWCTREKFLPKEHFGFVPERKYQQAQFIVRHLVQMRKWAGRGQDNRLGLSFIDFTAAYDHVDRQALWIHLQGEIGVPEQPLRVIQSMYAGMRVGWQMVSRLPTH